MAAPDSIKMNMEMDENFGAANPFVRNLTLLSHYIKGDFEKLKAVIPDEERARIEERLYHNIELWENSPKWQKQIYHSSGTEGGSSKFGAVRTKKLSKNAEENQRQVKECVRINEIVEQEIPGSTVYCYALSDLLLSENFYGNRLLERRKHSNIERLAPIEIILQHLTVANSLSLRLRPDGIIYQAHDYGSKIQQIWDVLSKRYDIPSDKLSMFINLAGYLSGVASVPNFDRHLENGKYDQQGIVKQMPDWTKVHFLVSPVYDAAQLIGQCNNPAMTALIREQTASQLKLPDINFIIDHNVSYYDLRQLMFAIVKHDEYYIKKFESAILTTDYAEWKQGEGFKSMIH